MDDALGFLKQKLSQGLSDVEQWGSDAGNDVSHALGQVFGQNTTSQNNPTQTAQAPQQTFSQAANPAIQLQAQPQQQTPLKTNLFNPAQQNSTINLAGQPQNLNTKLVNYQQPTQPAVKLGGQSASIAHDITHNPITNLVGNAGKTLEKNVVGQAQQIGSNITQFAKNPIQDVKNTVSGLNTQLNNPAYQGTFKNGKPVSLGKVNPVIANMALGAEAGPVAVGDAGDAADALRAGKAPDAVPDLTTEIKTTKANGIPLKGFDEPGGTNSKTGGYIPTEPLQQSLLGPEDLSVNKGAFEPEDIARMDQMSQEAKTDQTPFLSDEEFKALTQGPIGLQKAQDIEEQMGPEAWGKLTPGEKANLLGTNNIEGMDKITPQEAAVRVARGVKGRPGSFGQALKAYMKQDPYGLTKTIDESKAETSQALEAAHVTPIGGTRGEYAEGTQQLGVNPLPVNEEPDTVQQTKPEGNFVKLESLETRMSKQGAPGRELVQRATNVRNEAAMLETRMRDGTPTFFNLNKADQAEAWLIKEGKLAPNADTNPEVLQAVAELKETMPKIQQDALSAGLRVGDRGETYMPHMYDKGFFNKPANFAKAVKKLVKDGYADNTKDAIKLMNEYKNGDYMGGKVFSNLEKQREFDLPGYNMTDKELTRYYQGAAQRIAQSHQFGEDNEFVTNLIDRANKNGQDGKALQETFNKYWNPDKGGGGVIDKAGNLTLKTTRILQLQKAAISHLPQGFANIGSKVGFYNYFKAVTQRIFSPEDQQFVHDAGFDAEANHDLTGTRGVAPGLKQVREFHRQVAGIGGKNFAEALASKGDEDGLKAFGVTGDLAKDDTGKIVLSDAQKVQAANFLADKTIFSNDPIQNPAFTQGSLGKFIGQYRTSYTFKQAGFINNLFKEAGQGNIAPLLRYVGVALPVSGALVTIGKDLFTGKNPVTQVKQNPKQQLLDVATNSGGLSIGGGLGEDVVNDAAYNYNANSRDQNIAGNIAPVAGTAVQTGQNVDNALRGNKTALVKQALSYVPGTTAIENSRVGHALGVPITKPVTPAQQTFLTAWTNGRNQLTKSLSPAFSESANPTQVKQDLKTRDIANTFLDKDHNAQGQAILLNSQQKAANYAQLLSDPKAFAAVQKLEQSLPDHNPIWDSSDLKNYMTYESLPPGDPNRTVMEQKDPSLITTFNAESAWASKQNFGNNSVNGPGYIPYPPISASQSQMMSQVDSLASIQNRTPEQETQLTTLENNPDLQAAYSLLDNYTNSERTQNWGLQAIPYPSQNLTPQESALISQESALPSGTGQKTALIKANQDLWNQAEQIMGQDTMYDVEKYGGVVQQGGTEPNLLKDVYDAGQYDIAATKGANGTTSYSLNPALAYSNQQAANAASKNPPLVPLPKIKRPKKQSVKRPLHLKGFRAPHIKKATKVRVQANGRLSPTQVLKPTSVVKIKA